MGDTYSAYDDRSVKRTVERNKSLGRLRLRGRFISKHLLIKIQCENVDSSSAFLQRHYT